MPRVLEGSQGGGRFLMSEVPLYASPPVFLAGSEEGARLTTNIRLTFQTFDYQKDLFGALEAGDVASEEPAFEPIPAHGMKAY